jgi:hypothetical protein
MRLREVQNTVAESDLVALDVSWLTEYQPNGSNICFIHNWGIGATLRFLREDGAAEPAGKRLCPADTTGAVCASRQPEVPHGSRPQRETGTEAVRATEFSSQVAAEQASNVARRSDPREERKGGDFPEQVVRAAWNRQGGRCAGCGRWLIWSHRGRDGGIGAWRSQYRIPKDQGGTPTLANCVILCPGVANRRAASDPGGEPKDSCVQLGSSMLLYLHDGPKASTRPATGSHAKRSLLRAFLGIPQR